MRASCTDISLVASRSRSASRSRVAARTSTSSDSTDARARLVRSRRPDWCRRQLLLEANLGVELALRLVGGARSSAARSRALRTSSRRRAIQLAAVFDGPVQPVARLGLLVAARAELGQLDARLHHALLHALELAGERLQLQLQLARGSARRARARGRAPRGARARARAPRRAARAARAARACRILSCSSDSCASLPRSRMRSRSFSMFTTASSAVWRRLRVFSISRAKRRRRARLQR